MDNTEQLDRARKYAGRLIDRVFESGRPVILVFKEKHDDRRFACLDRGELEHACLDVLWERYHEDWYGNEDDDESLPNPPPIPKNDVDTMPDGMTKDAAGKEWKHYEATLSWHKEMTERLEMVTAALRDRDGAVAFSVLRACKDGEYEGFEYETAKSIDGPPKGDLLKVKPDWM